MDYPLLECFEEAIIQENENKRMVLVSKGLKKITDILPFQKQNHLLLLQKDILKYLFLNLPLFQPIVLIIDTFVEKFGNQQKFLEQFFSAAQYVSEIRDALPSSDQSPTSTRQSMQNSQQNIDNEMIGEDALDESARKRQRMANFSKFNLPKYLQNHSTTIKKHMLQYVKRIVKVIMKRSISDQQTYSESVCDFYKHFLDCTDNNNLIQIACKDLCGMKEEWEYLKQNHIIMEEVEEILLQKSKKFKIVTQNDDNYQEEPDDQSDQQSSQSQIEPTMKNQEKDAVDLLEDWLSGDDVAQVSKIKRETEGRLSIEFFKIDSNLEIVLSFVLNPTIYTCSKAWNYKLGKTISKKHFTPKPTTFRAEYYRRVQEIELGDQTSRNIDSNKREDNDLSSYFQIKKASDYLNDHKDDENKDKVSNEIKFLKTTSQPEQHQPVTNSKGDNKPNKIAVLYMRSYKTTAMLIDPKNYRPIVRINQAFIEVFCNKKQ